MATVLIGILVLLAMGCVAFQANKRLQNEERLPMQWLLPDHVIWSAPRSIALGFLPALAFLSFAGLAVLSLYVKPRPGQEGMMVPSLFAIGLLFLGVQIFHLWMVKITIRRNDR